MKRMCVKAAIAERNSIIIKSEKLNKWKNRKLQHAYGRKPFHWNICTCMYSYTYLYLKQLHVQIAFPSAVARTFFNNKLFQKNCFCIFWFFVLNYTLMQTLANISVNGASSSTRMYLLAQANINTSYSSVSLFFLFLV